MQIHPSCTVDTRFKRSVGLAIAVTVMAILWLAFAVSVSAQIDRASCGYFATREEAQVFFDSREHIDPTVFDPDGDGIACEFAFDDVDGGPAVVDPASCGHFETQEDAQGALDANPELATTLDADGNGIVCEEFQTGSPAVVDPVSCGHFETQEDAQEFFENRELDDPSVLDGDGDGIACEFASHLDTPTEAESESTTRVIALPNTGTGAVTEGVQGSGVFSMVLMMTSGAALVLRRQLVR